MGDAIAQGVVTVVGVLIGVGVAEWAIRARDRRHEIEEAALELAMLIPHVVIVIWAGWQGRRLNTSVGSEWSARMERVSKLVGGVRVRARWPLRRARAIRAEAEDLAVRLSAAHQDWAEKQKPVPLGEAFEISGAALYGAVFGGIKPLDDAVAFYQQHGYAAGRPPAQR